MFHVQGDDQGRAPMLLDIQDCNQTTALHMAACVGNTECVRVLLELGADSTKRNITGMTPLQACALERI